MSKIGDNELFVREYQKLRGLRVDGWAGSKTLDDLKKLQKFLPPVKVNQVVPPPSSLDLSKKTLWITAGHGGSDPGAVAHGLREADLTIDLRDRIISELSKEVKYWKDPDHWSFLETYRHVLNHAQSHDIVFDIHFNSASSEVRGVEAFVPIDPTNSELGLAVDLVQAVCRVTGSPARGHVFNDKLGWKSEAESARKRLGMMRPAGTNVLLEVEFITNKQAMKIYQANVQRIAEEISDVLEQAYQNFWV